MSVSWPAQQAIYTAFCGISFILSYIPLYWHLEAWNVGCVLWIFWSGTGALVYFINANIWRDNVVNWAPMWCDIVTRFLHVQPIGTVLASLLINHRLYKISRIDSAVSTAFDRRRQAIIDLSVGLGIPAVFVATYWFIQGHRFDIYEGVGCMPTTPFTIPWVFLFGLWSPIITFISGYFGVLTIRAFLRHRKEIDRVIVNHSRLTSYRYFRLMVFASVDVVFCFPFTMCILFASTQNGFYRWRGLGDLHHDFSRVDVFPAVAWVPRFRTQAFILPSLTIVTSFVFFAFFGLAPEARSHYRKAFSAVRDLVTSRSKSETTGSTIPSFIQRNSAKRESISSTLSVSVTVEGFKTYDPAVEPSKPQVDNDSKLDSPSKFRFIPRFNFSPLSPARHATPPTHSFDAPLSVATYSSDIV